MSRQTPRIILRTARRGFFGDAEVLVLEIGLGGAKFEHANRVDVGYTTTFTCGPLTTAGQVRHSVLLPARTGIVYQSGISFPDAGSRENELLTGLLMHEAQQQVTEWEANLSGVLMPPRPTPRRSAVALRFVALHRSSQGWTRHITADPNQVLDGITVVDGTPEEEVAVLCETYERADEATRELLRRVAMVAILEQLQAQEPSHR